MYAAVALLMVVACAQAFSHANLREAEWNAFKLKYDKIYRQSISYYDYLESEWNAFKSEYGKNYRQSLSYGDILEADWNAFKSEYGKSYSAEEEIIRFEIFKDNMNLIAEHNERWAAGEVSYELGLNEFADMLQVEFERYMLGTTNSYTNMDDSITYVPAEFVTLDEEVDWRKKGAVTPVKNQGQCGSCWAFSATGVLEGQHFQKTKQLIPLSVQNLLDCSTEKYHNDGCEGGWPHTALKYVQDNGGIDTEASYPYKAAQDICKFNRNNIGATVRGIVYITNGSETDLQNAVATKGPISVAINASQIKSYKGGVFNDPNCSKNTTHSVLIVGYGKDDKNVDYWIVKNSWGSAWGESGYIRMARGYNLCGIADEALYPLV